MYYSNYSFLDKTLHRLVLKSNLIKNNLYNLEKKIFSKNISVQTGDHIFITGLARSGTTSILNLFYNSGSFASLTYKDMPFILAPNLWNLINKNSKNSMVSQERVHGDGIRFNLLSPEAFEEVFWKHVLKDNYIKKNKLDIHTVSQENLSDFYKFINLILNLRKKNHYISKNNSNILRLESLAKYFNNSIFLIMFRHPINQASSLLQQHKKFSEKQLKNKFILEYMDFLGHHEFGLNHKKIFDSENLKKYDKNTLEYWLQLWCDVYEYLITLANKSNIHFICYEKLCNHPEKYLEIKIKKKIIIQNLNFTFLKNKNKNISYNSSNLIDKAVQIYNKMNEQVLK